jgi:hypothetical protein
LAKTYTISSKAVTLPMSRSRKSALLSRDLDKSSI